MSIRLSTGGRLIDRSRKIGFSFNGKRMSAHPGDTLAAALMANGQMIMGRSFKYHRHAAWWPAARKSPMRWSIWGQGRVMNRTNARR